VEETAVSAGSDLIDDIGLEVNIEGTGNVFSGRGLREEGAEPVITGRGGTLDQTTIRLVKGFVRKRHDSTRSAMEYSR